MEEEEPVLYDGDEEEEEGECLDGDTGDVEMLVAELAIEDGDGLPPPAEPTGEKKAAGGGDGGGEESNGFGDGAGGSAKTKNQKKKRRRRNNNRKIRKGERDFKITDINRFVLDTCKHLKEKKSYLVWNAVGCLGVSAVRDLVKEVDAIQACGGQQTSDGRRHRFAGGILWNILKTREPKAFKEIMEKGKEFEKQFRRRKTKNVTETKETIPPTGLSINNGSGDKADEANAVDMQPEHSKEERVSVLSRIRVPVAYDDLFEEGEIV